MWKSPCVHLPKTKPTAHKSWPFRNLTPTLQHQIFLTLSSHKLLLKPKQHPLAEDDFLFTLHLPTWHYIDGVRRSRILINLVNVILTSKGRYFCLKLRTNIDFSVNKSEPTVTRFNSRHVLMWVEGRISGTLQFFFKISWGTVNFVFYCFYTVPLSGMFTLELFWKISEKQYLIHVIYCFLFDTIKLLLVISLSIFCSLSRSDFCKTWSADVRSCSSIQVPVCAYKNIIILIEWLTLTAQEMEQHLRLPQNYLRIQKIKNKISHRYQGCP